MNVKFEFINDVKRDPIEAKLEELSEYGKIVKNVDRHYKLNGHITSKWEKSLRQPEYELLEENGTFKICSSDKITLVEIDNKDIAENIVILMNLAFREGAKQIIEVVKIL